MANDKANDSSDDMKDSDRSESTGGGSWKFPLRELIEKGLFNCGKCGSFFKAGVFAFPGEGTLCEICYDEIEESIRWQGVRLRIFDAVLRDLPVVPCTYAEAGCKLQVLPEDLEAHRKRCIRRPVQCIHPGCPWKNKQHDLVQHFREEHPEDLVDKKTVLNLDIAAKSFVVAKLIRIIEKKDAIPDVSYILRRKYYLLLLRRLMNSDDILYNMFRTSETDNHDGIIRHFSDDTQEFKKQIITEPLNMIDMISDSTLNKLSLAALKEILEVENQCSLTVCDTLSQLEKLLICSGCRTTMARPIYQCEKKHGICGSCCSTLSQCPVCQAGLETKTRNLSLEASTSDILYPCTYSEAGCSCEIPGRNLNYHEAKCYYRKFICPVPNCSYLNKENCAKGNRFEKHASDVHQQIFTANPYLISKNGCDGEARYIYFDGWIFELKARYLFTGFRISVRLLSEKSEYERLVNCKGTGHSCKVWMKDCEKKFCRYSLIAPDAEVEVYFGVIDRSVNVQIQRFELNNIIS